MDTHQVELPVSRAEAVRRAVGQVVAGGDAVLSVGFDAAAVLDDVSDLLADGRLRVLRCAAAGQGGLSLSGLLAQVTGRADLGGHDDEVLQRGFEALTTPGEGFEAVVLLVDGAEALQRSALRYLQFVARTAPGPRLVLACEGRLPDLYDAELEPLRTRLAAKPALVVGSVASSLPASTAGGVAGPVPLPTRTPQVVSRGPAWPGADAVPLPGAATALAGPQAGAPVPGAIGFVPLVVPHQASRPDAAVAGDIAKPAAPDGAGTVPVLLAGVAPASAAPASVVRVPLDRGRRRAGPTGLGRRCGWATADARRHAAPGRDPLGCRGGGDGRLRGGWRGDRTKSGARRGACTNRDDAGRDDARRGAAGPDDAGWARGWGRPWLGRGRGCAGRRHGWERCGVRALAGCFAVAGTGCAGAGGHCRAGTGDAIGSIAGTVGSTRAGGGRSGADGRGPACTADGGLFRPGRSAVGGIGACGR